MIRLAELHAALGGDLVGDGALALERIAPLESADAHGIAFVASAKLRKAIAGCAAGCLIVTPELRDEAAAGRPAVIVTDDPYLYYARLTQWWVAHTRSAPGAAGVHPAAVVAADAQLGQGVTVGAGHDSVISTLADVDRGIGVIGACGTSMGRYVLRKLVADFLLEGGESVSPILAAVRELGRIGDTEDDAMVVRALNSELLEAREGAIGAEQTAQVRLAASSAAQRIERRRMGATVKAEPTQVLSEMLGSGTSPSGAILDGEGLSVLRSELEERGEPVVARLVELASSSPSPESAQRAVDLLAGMGEGHALRYIGDDDEVPVRVRAAALGAIANRIGDVTTGEPWGAPDAAVPPGPADPLAVELEELEDLDVGGERASSQKGGWLDASFDEVPGADDARTAEIDDPPGDELDL